MTEYEAAVEYIRLADTVRVLTQVGWDPGSVVLEGCGEALGRLDAIRSGRPHVRRRKGWQHKQWSA